MISEVLLKEMLNENYSSRAIDLVIVTSVNGDWEGNVHLSTPVIADSCKSKTRYVNKLISKFQKKLGIKAPIRRDNADGSRTLQLNYGKIDKFLPQFNATRYVKAFNLFFDNDFINADVITKRLILVACYEYSYKKFPITNMSLSKIKNSYSSLRHITKQQVYKSINYIANSNLSKYFTVSLNENNSSEGLETLSFEFADFVKEDFVSNTTIYKVIRNAATECGYLFPISDEICKGISKQIGYIRNVLFTAANKNQEIENLKYDDIKALIKSFINESLFGMFTSLANSYEKSQEILGLNLSENDLTARFGENAIEISNGNKAAAYFAGVFKTLLQEEAAKIATNIAHLETLHYKSSPVLRSLKPEDIFSKQLNSAVDEIESDKQARIRNISEIHNEIHERISVLEDKLRLISDALLNFSHSDFLHTKASYNKEISKISKPKSIQSLKLRTINRANKILQDIEDIKSNTERILHDNIERFAIGNTIKDLTSAAKVILECCFKGSNQKIIDFKNELST